MIWIVEMLNTENREWEPTVGIALDRANGRDVLKMWKNNNPCDIFRLVQYGPLDANGRRDA